MIISADGIAKVFSPLLIEKRRGSESVNVKVFKMDESRQSKHDKGTVSGVAQNVQLKELEVGQLYWLEMTPVATNKKMFNYTTEIYACKWYYKKLLTLYFYKCDTNVI